MRGEKDRKYAPDHQKFTFRHVMATFQKELTVFFGLCSSSSSSSFNISYTALGLFKLVNVLFV